MLAFDFDDREPMFACRLTVFDKIPELEMVGMEEFAKQFPHDYTTDITELQEIRKKALQWSKRAVDYLKPDEDKRIAEGLVASLKLDKVKLDGYVKIDRSAHPKFGGFMDENEDQEGSKTDKPANGN